MKTTYKVSYVKHRFLVNNEEQAFIGSLENLFRATPGAILLTSTIYYKNE